MDLRQFWTSMLLHFTSLTLSSVQFVRSSELGSIGKMENLTEHLARKFREVKNEIAKEYISAEDEVASVVTTSYDIEWEKLGSQPLNFSEPTIAISIFEKMFILEGDRTTSVDVKSASNFTNFAAAPLPQAAFIRQGHSIKFAKSIVWKSRLFLLTCSKDDDCNIYIGENDSHLEHGQKMHHGGTIDAIFFTRDNRLYLVLTHEKTEQFSGSSTIYHWTGTYMDMIQPIGTDDNVLVTAFNYGRSTIIVFVQPRSENVVMEIYEFDNNKIERIQYLPIEGSISMIYYYYDRLDFLLVVNENDPSSVYWWDGNEFSHWLDLPDIIGPSRVNIVRLNGDTLFFVSYKDSVCLYKVARTHYSRLNLLDFKDNGEKVIEMAVRIDEKANLLTLILVTFDSSEDLYRIEPWRLHIKKNQENNSAEVQDALDATEQCLSKLEEKLKDRMEIMENLTIRVWPELFGSEDDTNDAKSLIVQDLILDPTDDSVSIKIGSIEIENWENSSEPLLPMEANKIIGATRILLSSFFNDSKKMLKIDGDNRLTGDVIIQGDTTFQSLETNFFRTANLNGHHFNLEDFTLTAISATRNQMFSNLKLRGKNITIRNLAIDQLCGIPHEYWLEKKNEKSNNIFLGQNLTDVVLENDTVLVKSTRDSLTTTLQHLELRTIDDVDLTDLFGSLFILGENQRIQGNIVQDIGDKSAIDIANLVTTELNGISAGNLITKNTEQNFTNDVFFGGNIVVINIVTNMINGIDIEDFAMVSKKNHISGDLSISNLRILNEFAIGDAAKFLKDRPVQIYDSVVIHGKMKAQDVVLHPETNFSLPSMMNIEEKYWTRSSSQTLKNGVSFEKGLTVDELKLEKFNDLDPNEDLMLTSVKEIFPKFYSLEFDNFTINRIANISPETNAGSLENPTSELYDDSEDSIIVNEKISIEQLSVTELFIQRYNGISVDIIAAKNSSNSSSYDYTEMDSIEKFESVFVNDRLEIVDLYATFISADNDWSNGNIVGEGAKKSLDAEFLRVDKNYTINRLEAKNFILKDVNLENFLDIKIGDFYAPRNNCSSMNPIESSSCDWNEDKSRCSCLVIEGDMAIEKNLQVTAINEKNSEDYFEGRMTGEILMNFKDNLIIENLHVRDNLTLNFLRGTRFETLYEKILSKSREQNLGVSKISFYEIIVDNLEVKKVNDREIRNLLRIDSEGIFFSENVTFSRLTVKSLDPHLIPDVRAKSLNGHSTQDHKVLYEKLGKFSSSIIGKLTIHGNISWPQDEIHRGSKNLSTFEKMTSRALLRNSTSEFVVFANKTGSTTIEASSGVFAASLRFSHRKIANGTRDVGIVNGINIGKILRDSVLDFSPGSEKMKSIEIGGEKKFHRDLEVFRLLVSEDISVRRLDRWKIKDLNDSIIRLNFYQERNKLFSTSNKSTVVFRGSVASRKLVIRSPNDFSELQTSPKIHGQPISGIFTVSEDRENFLPEFTHFQHLVILNNAFVKTLDSVDLDEFVCERVSLDPDSDIVVSGNIQFNGLVRVHENASAVSINGIAPSDLVVNESIDDQFIKGNMSFVSGDLTIAGKTCAPIVAGINLTDAYDNSVLNNKPSNILGDIIFESDVEKSSGFIKLSRNDWSAKNSSSRSGMIFGGLINSMDLRNFLEDRSSVDDDFFIDFRRNESSLESRVSRIANIHLPEIFHYLEDEKNLIISNVANVERVRIMKMEETTILAFYTNELGHFCQLPDNCSCRRQYVAEISENGDNCRSWKVQDPRIFFHFHEKNGAFGVSVATNTVSKSDNCRLFNGSSDEKKSEEFTTISWTRNEKLFLHRRPTSSASFFGAKATKDAPKIRGYLSDAFVFTRNNLVYIVLAIFYDPINSSHRTDSLIYELDLSTNSIKLAQTIPTSHAVGIQVFDVPSKGPHVFFSCFANGNPTESFLYRLENNTEFRLLKKFPSGGNRHARSVSRSKEELLLLDDFGTNSINVYRYDTKRDNFFVHQSILHDSMSPVTSIETFYSGEFRYSQVYVIVTTERDEFFIYEHTLMGNFQRIGGKKINGVLSMVPFEVANRRYVFLGTDRNSTVLRIVEQGSSYGVV